MWLTGNLKIWLYSIPTDMRKSIDGLSVIVADQLNRNPCGSDIFVFYNRASDKLKILYWDKNGFWLFYKRLEKGHFKWPAFEKESIAITRRQLSWLLEGLMIEQKLAHRPLNVKITA